MTALDRLIAGATAAIVAAACGLPFDALAKKKPVPARAKVHRTSRTIAQNGAPSPAENAARPRYDQRAEVQAFIAEMAAKNGFVEAELEQLFARTRYSETAARLMAPPPPGTEPPPKNWRAYRARFLQPVRIDAGAQFWRDNAETLARAAEEFGVPEEIIVGIIGVETIYGRNAGGFRVIDALTTLAFDYPAGGRDRSAFFRAELEEYLLFARDAGLDLLALKGSYAGAIGIPQFMPSSYRHYAIDYDGDGVIDLRTSAADAIGSVANFLVQHGWQRGIVPSYPVISAAPADPEVVKRMVGSGGQPSYGAAEMKQAGLIIVDDIPPGQPLALIDLPNEIRDGAEIPTEYVLGTQNFHAITRYNRSYFYAMAVIELGAAVKRALDLARVP